jgi:S-adenosylmethionine hydrolase
MQRRLFILAAGLALAGPALAARPQAGAHRLRPIGFMTDFDLRDDAVAICKAVMDGVAPGVRITDITHTVEPYNVAQAARFLAGTAPYFAKDAVFVVVVDPGVGSTRKAIIAKSARGQFFVLPDNGLITLLKGPDAIVAAREIANTAWMIGEKRSSTFHGRDIFSPAAAHLARGDDWTQAGPELDVTSLVRLDLKTATLTAEGVKADVIGTDGPYGNLILDLPAETFAKLGYGIGDVVPVDLDGKRYAIPFVKTFSDVPVGKPLFYIDSRGRLSLAINQGDFSEAYKAKEGSTLFIPRKAAA